MFQNALVNGSKYCGPTSISCVTGVGTKEICKVVRDKFPWRKQVKGLFNKELLVTLDHFGVKYQQIKMTCCTLRNWVDGYMRKGTTYILNLTGHYVVVSGDEIVCTQFKGQRTPLSNSKYLRTQVLKAWMITSEPKASAIPSTKRVVDPIKQKLKALCKEHDIELDDRDYRRSKGERMLWVYLSEEMINSRFGGVDPWEEDHTAADYEEALGKAEEVLIRIKNVA